ncbi:unnamed protein product, partial [Ilex paraguariensis]
CRAAHGFLGYELTYKSFIAIPSSTSQQFLVLRATQSKEASIFVPKVLKRKGMGRDCVAKKFINFIVGFAFRVVSKCDTSVDVWSLMVLAKQTPSVEHPFLPPLNEGLTTTAYEQRVAFLYFKDDVDLTEDTTFCYRANEEII